MVSVHELLLEAWNFRFSCKEFDPNKKINDNDFHIILECGRLSASSFGFEPWSFIVLQDKTLRSILSELSWGGRRQIPTASHVVIILARKSETLKPDSVYIRETIMKDTQHLPEDIAQARADKYDDFLQNDFELTFGTRACFEWVARQTYIALANMMTAAAFLKIDSCAIEGFTKKGVEELLAEKQLMDINTFGVSCIVTFGYRTSPPAYPKTRRSQKDVVQWV